MAALAVGLVAAAPSSASFPAAQQRLVILTEASGSAAGLDLLGPGTQRLPLQIPLGANGSAAFSADGTHLALNFSVPYDPADPNSAELITGGFLNADGGEVARNVAGGGRPSWSPDGTKIAYADKVSGKWDVFVAASDGSSPVNVSNGSGNDRNPRWSPDGSKIAFESDRSGDWEVFSMSPDGSGQTDLTNDAGDDRLGDWSPDSRMIVFSSTRSGGGDLYLMPAAGGAATRLTALPGADTHAAWSPDGTLIAFSNETDGSSDVYEIASSGGSLTRLTDNSYVDLVQDWQPLVDTVAPTARAIASKGRRGHTVQLRFRASENAGPVGVDVQAQWSTKHGFSSIGVGRLIAAPNPSHTYAIGVPPFALRGAPKSFRFCVQATDGSLNQSAKSCARFTFLKAKKKKKR
jgi:WD40-like Beta Propeller Repeat